MSLWLSLSSPEVVVALVVPIDVIVVVDGDEVIEKVAQ